MDDAARFVGEVLRLLGEMGIVAPWVVLVAAVLAVVVVVTLRHLGLGALLTKAWVWLKTRTPPEVMPGENQSPPMDLPPRGIPIPPKEWKDGEP